jgi:hypothetical protein
MDQLLVDRQWQTRSIAIHMGLRFPDDEQLIRGARDKSAAVRWAVLFRVDRPREAVELIALDSDDINRQHAESMLAGDPHMSDQVVTSARDDRARAARGLSFDPPPTL